MDLTPTIRRWALFAAATLGIAAAWHGLFLAGIAVPLPPVPVDGASQEFNVQESMAWFRTTQLQRQVILLIATAGFLGLAGLGGSLGRQPGSGDPGGPIGWDSVGRLLVAAGLVGAVAHTFQLGGHQAVAVASDVLLRLDGVALLHFTIDQVQTVIAAAAYGLFGSGLIASAIAGRVVGASALWRGAGGLAGGALLGVAASRLTFDPLDVADPLLFVAAFALFPAWAVGLPAALGARAREPSRRVVAVASR